MIFRKYKSNNKQKFQFKICYFNGYESGTKRWQAIFLNIGKTTYWVFRNKDIFNGWPGAA